MKTIDFPYVRLHFRTPGTPLPGEIQFAIGSCTYGALLVARSNDGICAIFLGDDFTSLEKQLAEAFPASILEESPSSLKLDLEQVTTFIDAPANATPLNLVVGGTAFQQRVWQSLCAIPAGTTRSYTDIAKSLGDPGGARAVAGACAANVLAIAIPCHRVVRIDGAISGYRWGPERKHSLLRRERQE